MEFILVWATIAVGLIGYFLTYSYSLSLARRADRLKYINSQLDELYGPLYIITQTGRILFHALQAKRLKRRGEDDEANAALVAQTDREWRTWVEAVFQPLNEQLERIIINKAHLVIEEDMPQSLKRFLAHSAGYKAVIKEWEQGNYTERNSIIDYPNELLTYAEVSFKSLRKEQMKLIRHRKDKRRGSQADEETGTE